MKRKMGPNDANHIVWAISTCLVRVFCSYPCFFTYTNHLTDSNGISKLWRYLQKAMTKRMGPNDVKHIVWAISTFFFLLCFF